MFPTSLVDATGPSPSPVVPLAPRDNGRPFFADRPVDLTTHSDAVRPPASADQHSGRSLLRVLDLLVEGALIADAAGATFYRNPALERMLLEDEDRGSLLREMRQLAVAILRSSAGTPATSSYRRGTSTRAAGGALAESGCVVRETRTAAARYRMRATTLDDALPDAEHAAALVTLERLTLALPSPMVLADRFRLTASEAGVALLLAQGHSNGVIAKRLGISPHTARHHTESVLLKLNVHSRAEVGGKVLGTRRPSGPVRSTP